MIGEDARREGFQELDSPHHPIAAPEAPCPTAAFDAITIHVLSEGQVVAIDGGSNNTGLSVITSDMPLLVAHLGRDSADSPLDASPALPSARLWEIQGSQMAYVGASQDLTGNIYADDGAGITDIVLNAGERCAIHNVGALNAQGLDSDPSTVVFASMRISRRARFRTRTGMATIKRHSCPQGT